VLGPALDSSDDRYSVGLAGSLHAGPGPAGKRRERRRFRGRSVRTV